MRKPLFPFDIGPNEARRLAKDYSDFQRELRLYETIVELRVYGDLSEDGTLRLWAWKSTDNGFCQTAGKFWEHAVKLNAEQVSRYAHEELKRRAIVEIAEEDEKILRRRTLQRLQELYAELLPNKDEEPE